RPGAPLTSGGVLFCALVFEGLRDGDEAARCRRVGRVDREGTTIPPSVAHEAEQSHYVLERTRAGIAKLSEEPEALRPRRCALHVAAFPVRSSSLLSRPDLAAPKPRSAMKEMGGAEPPGATRSAPCCARAWQGWRAPDLLRSEHRGTIIIPSAPALAMATRRPRIAAKAATNDPDRGPDPLPSPASDQQGTPPGCPGNHRPRRRAGLGQAARPDAGQDADTQKRA